MIYAATCVTLDSLVNLQLSKRQEGQSVSQRIQMWDSTFTTSSKISEVKTQVVTSYCNCTQSMSSVCLGRRESD